MSESQHTAGPWRVSGKAGYAGHSVVDASGRSVAAFPSTSKRPKEERDANASLIAAAPETAKQRDELLAALTFLMEVTEPPERNCSCHISPPCGWCVEYSQVAEAHEQAKAAIAAAKGGAA